VGRESELLGLAGGVVRQDLVALLRGCHPYDGHFLPAWKPSRRRSGWDLTLAAPKSVSLLAAVATTAGTVIMAAQRSAVDEVVDDFERRLLGLQRTGEAGERLPSRGLVAAAFEHGVNESGDPHLHSHLLICNLGRAPDGIWSSLSHSWWTARRSLSAVYQLNLRYQLGTRGLDLEWRLHDDGLADLAGVPRAAVRSASGRSQAAAADTAVLREHWTGRRLGRRVAATVRTRAASGQPDWSVQATAAGFGRHEADRMIDDTSGSVLDDGRLGGAVTTWLAAQRSSFRHADVLVALAACAPSGLSGSRARRWADQFCAAAVPVPVKPTWAPRWTTPLAQAADQRLEETVLAHARRGPGRFTRARDATVKAVAEAGEPAGLSPTGRAAAVALLTNPARLHVLHAPPGTSTLLAQAAVLEVAATVWGAAGQRVSLATSNDQAGARWRTLTGLVPSRAVTGSDIVVVDHADRRSTAELLAVLADLDRRGAVAILVEGGSSVRLSWLRSDGLARLGDRVGRLDPGPPPVWADGLDQWSGEPPKADGATCPTAALAASRLLVAWKELWSAKTDAVLVGLGQAEIDRLNQAAREVLVRRGEVSGPALSCGRRVFQPGDRVLALRRLLPDLPGGTVLQVLAVDARRTELTVAWDGHRAQVHRQNAAHLGYAYAVTPAYVGHTRGPLLMLGPPEALGRHRSRVAAAAMVAPGRLPPTRSRGREWDRGASIGLGV
jgi:conjugative relaxase-like TrwC/TraI family protein